MRIEVRCLRLSDEGRVKEHAARKLEFHFGRLAGDIDEVTLRVGDDNGPRGGVDKTCQVTVTGPRIPATIVEESHDDALAAVDVAIERAVRATRRALDRAQVKARGSSATIRGLS